MSSPSSSLSSSATAPAARGQPILPEALRERLCARVFTLGPREGEAITSPLTEGLLGMVPWGTPEDAAAAVHRARAAQPAWAARSFKERGRVLLRLRELVLERQDEVLDLIQLEAGKVRAHAFEEVADTAIVANYYARHAAEHLKPRKRKGALPLLTTTYELQHPRGVIGFIAPWNYPLSMAISDAIPALMAGNGCVVKPAPTTPFTALWIADLAYEAGLPPDLLQMVTGPGPEVGAAIIGNVDFVTFTGSTRVGRIIGAQTGEHLIDCALELGGKNAMIVLEDADMDRAVEGAVRGCFASAGQLCVSMERLYVHRSILDTFKTRFVEAVESLRLSAELAYGGDIGSLQSRAQLATVTRHVEDARAHGVTILTGGEPRTDVGPLFYAPTILTDVTPEMAIYREETFGPVITVYPFDTVEEVVAEANDSNYGLNSSIWTRNIRLGWDIATRIKAGTVNINDAYAAAWSSIDAPMGGFKDSGIGRRHGREGIWKYTELQTVARQRLAPAGEIPFFSLSQAATVKVITRALNLLHRIPGLR